MKKVSRRVFSGAMLSASALRAQEPGDPLNPARVDLPSWKGSPAGGDGFEFPGPPSPRTKWTVPGPPRKYFPEWLPALFERTIEIDDWGGGRPQLRWIFTGPSGGFTVEAGGGTVRLAVRYYDSPGLSKVPPVQARPGRHPEGLVGGDACRVRRRPESHHRGGRLSADRAGPAERERGALFPRDSGCEPPPTGFRGRGRPATGEAASAGRGSGLGRGRRRRAVPEDARMGRHYDASGVRRTEPAGRAGVVAYPRGVQPAACIASIQPARF